VHALPAAAAGRDDSYLVGPGHAWFAFAMTIGLMIFDYVDRQVIVSLFPHLKAEWGLTDKELGAMVSVVSVTVAVAGIPVALFADRVSRVKSIVAMACIWSVATVSCMFTRNHVQLLAARAVVGLGEAGYGSVGAGLLASHFPARMRGLLMAGFFASASVGSVLGVMLGGVIAARWGWQAAFGVVGFPGLVLALMYLLVRDYRTVDLAPRLQQARRSTREACGFIVRALVRSRTTRWVCVGAPAQLIVVSALWSWLPSFLHRAQGMTPQDAAVKAAMVVLAGALGSVVWGGLADRAGRSRPAFKLQFVALLCLATVAVLGLAFGAPRLGLALTAPAQLALIVVGGFFMTCTVGPAAAIVIDVTHPGVRSTGASVLSLFQNLFGLAVGPFVAGALSDAFDLETALAITPLFGLLAAAAMLVASRSYEVDSASAQEAPARTSAPAAVAATA
jgi:MFS transporter, Spinster family, sphingosine-1-phosphate transporter